MKQEDSNIQANDDESPKFFLKNEYVKKFDCLETLGIYVYICMRISEGCLSVVEISKELTGNFFISEADFIAALEIIINRDGLLAMIQK